MDHLVKHKLGLLCLLATGCHFVDPQPPPGPSGSCAAACAHLRDLGCPDGQPTPAGTSCEAVCEDTTTSGLVRLDLACLAAITACSEEPRCSR